MDFDELLEASGPFGKYQGKVVVLLYIAAMFSALPVQQDVFVSYSPDYRCEVPRCEDSPADYDGSFLNFTIPWNEEDEEFDSCSKYKSVNSSSDGKGIWRDSGSCSVDAFDATDTEDCGDQFVYSDEVFSSSTVIEFSLTCDRAKLIPLFGMSYMLGALVGSIVVGALGDYLGRRLVFVLVVMLFSVSGLIGGLSGSFWLLVVTRFLTAVGGNGIFQLSFILCVENVVPQHRVPVGIFINAPYALGGAVVAMLSYFIRDNWRLLACLFTVPGLVLMAYYWLLPESARWLLSKGRQKEGLEVMTYIAAVNGRTDAFDKHISDERQQGTTHDTSTKLNKSIKEEKSVIDLLRLPNMRRRCLINFFIWPSVTLVYYGVSLNSVNLGGNIFLNFLLSMVIEIPAYIAVFFTLDRFGRKGTLLSSLLLSGIPCFASGFLPPESTAAIPLSLVGKFGAAAAFSIIYVYASELFPTAYRSIGVGACSMCARVGGILAPLIAGLGQLYYEPLPLLVFGILTLISGALVLPLPETAGCSLPTTLDESESFGRLVTAQVI